MIVAELAKLVEAIAIQRSHHTDLDRLLDAASLISELSLTTDKFDLSDR